jgi:Secretion system C-terminal sorting domain
MKTLQNLTKVIFITLFIYSISFAQPLNNSFENWDGTTGMPIDWFSNPPAVSQTNIAQEGSSAAHLEVVNFAGFAYIPVLESVDASFNGHPVSEKHGSLQGWYQFMPLGNDVLFISITMQQGSGNVVGAGGLIIRNSTSGWTQFTVPIFYSPGSQTPDNTIIAFIIADSTAIGENGTIGSMGYLDNLSFTGPATDVEQVAGVPQDYMLKQNYPNPFNPSTKIEYSVPEESFVELIIYDILGNEIVTLVNEQQAAGSYRVDFNANNKSAGLYFARLSANDFTKVIKMTLLK